MKYKELIERMAYFDEEKFNIEYLGIPVTVSDGARIEEMQRIIKKLEERNFNHAFTNTTLKTENKDLKKKNEELIKENRKLREENNKIHNRFDILDL